MKDESEQIPDILKINSFKGKKVLTFERLREISICLSNLSINVELPIIKILLECEELEREPNEYKSLVLNSIFDCLRVGLPLSSEYYSEIISESELTYNTSRSKLKNGESKAYKKVNLNVINGIQEHIELVLKYIKNENLLNKNSSSMTTWIYSLERLSEDNSKILACILENIYPNELRKEKLVLVSRLYLDLLENSVIYYKQNIIDICKNTLIGLLYNSRIKDHKNEIVLLLLVKLSNCKTGNNSKFNLISNICAILSKAGASSISYFINKLLVETIKYMKSKFNKLNDKKEPLNKDCNKYWWRNNALMMPEFIKELINENVNEQELNKIIVQLIYFLNNIDNEYVQAAITQLVCDLKEKNDKIRFQVVKLVSKLISLNYECDNDILGNSKCLHAIIGEKSSFDKLNSTLLDSWISRLNDKQSEIRNNVFNTLIEIINSFSNKEFNYEHIKIVKIITEYGHISCPNIRENIVISLSNWVTHIESGKNNDQIVNNTVNECIQYLLKHMSDKNRNVRLFLIGYFKNYKTKEIVNNLWFLWYISYKQNDSYMRTVIEEILVEFDSFEILTNHLNNYNNSNTNSNKSNITTYKIIKTFINQRFELYKCFKLLTISIYLSKKRENSNNEVIYEYINALKNKISNQISRFFLNDKEVSTGSVELLNDIENTLFDKNVLFNWSLLLGLDFNEKNYTPISSNVIDELSELINHKNKAEFRKILSYIRLFNINGSSNYEDTLSTILLPNISIVNCSKAINKKQANYVNTDNIDEYAIDYILKLQFKYMISCIHYFINDGINIDAQINIQGLVDYFNYIIGLYNQMDIFKLYENYYFVSKSVFRNKLIKYLSVLNSKSDILNIFNNKMAYECFSSKFSKHNFIFEIIDENNDFDAQIKCIIYQIFNNIDSYLVNNTLMNYNDMYNHFKQLKKKLRADKSKRNCIDMFILFLEIEKKRVKSNEINNEQIEYIIDELNSKLCQELKGDKNYIWCNITEILKLIKVINQLFFKLNNINEQTFSEYFNNIHALFKSYLMNDEFDFDDSTNNLEFANKYKKNKMLIEYIIRKDEYNKEDNIENIKNNIKIFGFIIYFELINDICFSELKEFFRKNHLKMLDIFELNDNDSVNKSKIVMFSRLVMPPNRVTNKSILTTTLGRSIGIFILPILLVYSVNNEGTNENYLLENMLNIFLDSTINSSNIKFEQLYCIIDCIISVFIYYILVTDSITYLNNGLLINEIIHTFVKVFYNQLSKKITGKFNNKSPSEHIYNIGIYCISLLEELSINHEVLLENNTSNCSKIEYSKPSLSDFCHGLQLHFSYFFINKNDPNIYRRESTDVFDLWNYLLNTSKYRIPCYLFTKMSNHKTEHKSNIIWSIPLNNSKKNTIVRKIKKNRKVSKKFNDYEHFNDENKRYNSESDDCYYTSSDESEEYKNPKIRKTPNENTGFELRRSDRLKNHQVYIN
ncbi:hypothetical protein RS030_142144 [Cryptosporidium xiaoi]|uniref:Uncharacterized protein n=1 Tax=Cryptosporidium xiaoi TaxID=659607 RepID=A0AAV9Y2Q1_9CRYT